MPCSRKKMPLKGDDTTPTVCVLLHQPLTQVSTRNPLQKGVVVGAAAPLLVHQTLANREQVLVCASCHRFVGTPATQLAMLEGLSRWTATSTTNTKKRPRCGDAALDPVSPPAVDQASSRRIAVACAPPSRLPDLPAAAKEATVEEGENGSQKDEEEGAGGVWRCKGGSPCDDVYCSDRCREAALVGGHGLICLGGSGPGRSVWSVVKQADICMPCCVGLTLCCTMFWPLITSLPASLASDSRTTHEETAVTHTRTQSDRTRSLSWPYV